MTTLDSLSTEDLREASIFLGGVLLCREIERSLGYTSDAGVSGESDTISRDASSVLTPLAARLRVHGSKP